MMGLESLQTFILYINSSLLIEMQKLFILQNAVNGRNQTYKTANIFLDLTLLHSF